MKKSICTMVFVALSAITGFSQFSIEGIITDKVSSELLPGAHIIIVNSYQSTISNTNGEYIIKNLKKGDYSVRVSYIGYQTIEKEVKISKDTSINFNMQTKSILGDEIIIRATRADAKAPMTYTYVSQEEIQDKNLGQDLPYIIETTPSTVVTSDAGTGIGYTNIRIRGTDITRINVTINGIPYNDPESHGVFFVDIPDIASSIENIQIQRGVGTSTNGAAAFGASINIQTLQLQPDPYAEINSVVGSFNTFKNSISIGTGLINGKWSFDGRLSKITSDGYIDRAFSDLKSFYIAGGFYGEKSTLKLVAFSGKEKTYQAWYGVPKDSLKSNRTYNPCTYENETDNYQQDHYQLHYSKEISKHLYLTTSLFYIHGEGYYEQFKDDRKFADYQLNDVIIGNDTITETDLIQQKWLDNDFYGLTFSLNYRYKKINSIVGGAWNNYEGEHFGKVIWARFASNGNINHQWYNNDGNKKDFNIFAKISYQITDKLSIYGDLQYRKINFSIDGIHDDLRDLTQTHNFNFLNPKVGIFYDINSNQNTYFSFAVSNREPNRSNYRDADKGYQPQPEKLYDYELGYNLKTSLFAFETNLFYMQYKDQLVLTGEINDVGAPIMTNVPESYRAGIELAAGLIIFPRLKWNFNTTFSSNKIKNFTEYVDNWSPPYEQVTRELGNTDLSLSPNLIIGSIIDWEPVDNLSLKLISKYVSRQYIDNTSDKNRSLDPYFVNDVSIIYSIKTTFIKEIGLTLMVNNIFNVEYESFAWVYRYYYNGKHHVIDGYFPQAGINFLTGVNLKF
ncbi:MAG: TonB-dependent receptor [Bacteroidetes bacterium]|nr:TonB-dependent receptor [Bacteroidota bacterium]